MTNHSSWKPSRLSEHQLECVQMVLTAVAIALSLGCVLLLLLV